MNSALSEEMIEILFVVGIIGGVFGLIGGFLGSRRSLLGSVLLGVIGGISLSAIMRIAGFEAIMPIDQGFSAVYAAIGGLVLGFTVNRSTA
ncbi:MAG: hypothetical protein ACRDWH_06265 [Acidimicrobiia bacterium]